MRILFARIGGLLSAMALIICLFGGTARAAGPVFEVATYLLPPMSRLDQGGEPGGTAVEKLGRILSAMGYTPKFHILPFRRCLEAMRTGAMPLMLPCVVDIERQRFMRFSDPMEYMRTVLWKLRTNTRPCWKSLDDLAGLRIGVIDGYRYGPEWQEAVAAGRFQLEGNIGRNPNRANFRMLLEGRLDMVVCDRRLGEYLKKENAPLFDNVVACPGTIGEDTPLCVPVSLLYFKNHGLSPEEFLARFNVLLKKSAL